MAYPKFSSIFPAFLGQKRWVKLGKYQLFPTRLKNFKRSGWPIPTRPKIWDKSRRFGLPAPDNPDGPGTFKNPPYLMATPQAQGLIADDCNSGFSSRGKHLEPDHSRQRGPKPVRKGQL